MDVLNITAASISATLSRMTGAADVKVEQTSDLSVLTVNTDREKTARFGLNVADIQDVVAIAVGGREAGTLFQGDRRFSIIIRLPENLRNDLDAIKRLPIPLPLAKSADGRTGFVPLSEVETLELPPRSNQISREYGKRRIVVSANVRARDIGSFVTEAQQRIWLSVKIPPGHWTTWGGQFEQLQSATRRLEVVIPVALLMVFILLFTMFGSLKDDLLVFTGIPFALPGGFIALWRRDIPIAISSAVGFIALSGVAVLNGLVMISFIRSLRENGHPLTMPSAREH
jgi:cobalt-zinc-cadmium resistance protein CzcA